MGKNLKRLKHDTAQALGVGDDVDYKRLQRIQRERAESISGVTKVIGHIFILVLIKLQIK